MNFCIIIEDRNVAYNVTLLDFDNLGNAIIGWKCNTTGLFLKEHVFNISIVTTNGTIVRQEKNLGNAEVEFLGLDQYSNYTFIIQSKNKYTYSKKLTFKVLAHGKNTYYFIKIVNKFPLLGS